MAYELQPQSGEGDRVRVGEPALLREEKLLTKPGEVRSALRSNPKLIADEVERIYLSTSDPLELNREAKVIADLLDRLDVSTADKRVHNILLGCFERPGGRVKQSAKHNST